MIIRVTACNNGLAGIYIWFGLCRPATPRNVEHHWTWNFTKAGGWWEEGAPWLLT